MALKTYYLVSGSKDGIAMTWNLQEGTFVGKIDCDSPINAVKFNIKKYWLFVGTDSGLQIWDYPNQKKIKDIKVSPLNKLNEGQKKSIACTSLALDNAGQYLFAGFADGYIRIFEIGK
jgi:guanine nucleotide-binding protein subunit beta-2-like 1 protein